MDFGAQKRGGRLREERERLSWSQQQAANSAGIRREMWARYEAGAEPGANVLSALAAAGADVLYILTGERSGAVLTKDEGEMLTLFRAAPLMLKAAAIGALQGGSNQTEKPVRRTGRSEQQFNAPVHGGNFVVGDVLIGKENA